MCESRVTKFDFIMSELDHPKPILPDSAKVAQLAALRTVCFVLDVVGRKVDGSGQLRDVAPHNPTREPHYLYLPFFPFVEASSILASFPPHTSNIL